MKIIIVALIVIIIVMIVYVINEKETFSSSAEVDPLITGEAYKRTEGMREIYSGNQGLKEYSSSGGEGDLGVDIGPIEYDENTEVIDNCSNTGKQTGLPETWKFPSTPVVWLKTKDDHYGLNGPTLSKKTFSLTTPDHDPLV